MEQVSNSLLTTDIPPKVLTTIGKHTFILHENPVINKSAYFRERIKDKHEEESALCAFILEDFPGGANTFKIISKFWHDEEYELTSSNVIPIICAAHHLQMMEDCFGKNLINQAEKFSAENIITNWKESIQALISCEDILKQADKLDIVSKCLVSIAHKVMHYDSYFSYWWYRDVCCLNLALFKRLVQILRAMGHDALDISKAVAYYANEYDFGFHPDSSGNWAVEAKKLLEEIVGLLLSVHNGVNMNKYLVSMLRASKLLNASSVCIESLEKKIGKELDEYTLHDLLEPDFWNRQEVALDICCIGRIIEHFLKERFIMIETFCCYYKRENLKRAIDLQLGKIMAIGTTVDEYLEIAAMYSRLKPDEFVSLASMIPDEARPSHDDLYFAIDAYIECHPWLCKQQSELLCQLLDMQKMSQFACKNAIMNFKRLPEEFVFKVCSFELVHIGRWLDEEQKACKQEVSTKIQFSF